jgi:hypothetical protein
MSVPVARAQAIRGYSALVSVIMVASAALSVVVAPAPAHAATVNYETKPLHSWRAVGVGWAALTIGNTAYLGGAFTKVTSPDGKTVVPRQHLAAFNLSTGKLIQSFKADTDGTVYALASDGTNLYVGGSFTHVNGESRARLAAVDPVTGAVRPWTANADSTVYALTTSSSYLFAGGSFGHIGGKTRHNIAKLALSDAAVQSWAPAPNATIHSVAATPDAGRVYFGGYFGKVNGQAAADLAAVDSNGRLVPRSWGGLAGPALAMQLNGDGSRLVIGMGGGGNEGAMYNTSNGAQLWHQRCNGDGQAVRWIGNGVFTGFHDTCGTSTSYVGVTENDASTGHRVTSFEPTFNKFPGVKGLAGDIYHLVAAGDFTKVSGVSVEGIAIFPSPNAPPVDSEGRLIPTVTAAADNPSGEAGRPVHASITVAGGLAPAGRAAVKLYRYSPAAGGSCPGAPVFSATVPVNGDGTYQAPATAPMAGTYSWIVSYAGDSQNAAASSVCGAPHSVVTLTDTTPPTVRIVRAGHRIQLRPSFRVRWAGSDAGSGIASYDVHYTSARWDNRTGAAVAWRSAVTARSARFVGTPGSEYCFTARARDSAGNLSGWSRSRCTALPLDDRSLTRSAGWSRLKGRHFYRHTALEATRRGVTLTATGVSPGKVALLVDRGRHYGRVAVRYGGHTVATVRLAGKPRDAVAVRLPDVTVPTKITITTTSGKRVRIDGLWIAPTA